MFETAMVVIASVLTAVVGYVGVRYTARASREAAEITATLHAPETISAGYDRLNEDLWRQLLDARANETETRMRYRAAIAYVRMLLSALTLYAPEVPLPEPPPELAGDVRVNGKGRNHDVD